MKKHLDYLMNETDYEVAALFIQGSQNYGLDEYSDNYKSDVDTKAIVLPSFQDFVCGKAPVSTTIILDNNEHIDVDLGWNGLLISTQDGATELSGNDGLVVYDGEKN